MHHFGTSDFQQGTQQFGGHQLGNQSLQGIQGLGQQGFLQQGQQGQQMQQQGQAAQFGAHETMQVHEILSSMIEGINRFNVYKQFIKDPQLNSIMSNQLNHMNHNYDNIVSYLHNRGSMSSMPYHGIRKSPSVQYGLRNPSPMHPISGGSQPDDRDVAISMLSFHKSNAVFSTLAALECADPTLRKLMQDSANSCINQAYECFLFMNQRGMYQVPTMQQNTTNTMINSYQ